MMVNLPHPYSIRPLEYSDLRMVLDWRNSERIHSVMLTEHRITWEEHLRWFQSASQISPRRQLIFMCSNIPIGYIGYNAFDNIDNSCSPGAYMGDINSGVPIDAAFYLFLVSIDYAFEVLQVSVLRTEVFKKNKRALKIDKALGYSIVDESNVTKNGVTEDIYILELKLSDWEKHKLNFAIYSGGK